MTGFVSRILQASQFHLLLFFFSRLLVYLLFVYPRDHGFRLYHTLGFTDSHFFCFLFSRLLVRLLFVDARDHGLVRVHSFIVSSFFQATRSSTFRRRSRSWASSLRCSTFPTCSSARSSSESPPEPSALSPPGGSCFRSTAP